MKNQICMNRFMKGLSCAVAAVAWMSVAAPAQAANTTHMVAVLRGGQEVPPNAGPARGCAIFTINTNDNTLAFYISYGGLTAAETAAHIHGPADPGFNAGVVFGLPASNPKVGTWTYPEAMEADILDGRMYVNIHTAAFPGGEIRGQIVDMVAILDGAQENPAAAVASEGFGLFNIDTCNNILKYHIVVESLSANETAAHIHGMSLHGANSGVLETLPSGMLKTGSWNYLQTQERAILDGQTYVNVHTTAFPGGEIRGQIVRIVAPINSAQEVPPNPSNAKGCAFCSLNRDTNNLGFYITYGGLTSPETAAHFHGFSPPGVNSGVLFTLPSANPKKGVWAYAAAQEANIFNDLVYINIHTQNFGGGEIRGQVNIPLDPCSGDANCDGFVDVNDLLAVINSWGICPKLPLACPADVNGDGGVNVDDLLMVINAWGKCP